MLKLVIPAMAISLFAFQANAQDFDSLEQQPAPVQEKTSDVCKDDPRLETELVEIMESTSPVQPAITVMPETYLNLDSDVLKRLAGQMIICPNNPVLKNGKPSRKVVIDFEPVWQAIQVAANKGDWGTVKNYFDGFTVKPKSTEEIVTMLAPVQQDKKIVEALFKAGGIAMGKGYWQPEIVDVYSRLGGKPSDRRAVVLSVIEVRDKDGYLEKYKDAIFLPVGSSIRYSIDKLKRMGINTVEGK